MTETAGGCSMGRRSPRATPTRTPQPPPWLNKGRRPAPPAAPSLTECLALIGDAARLAAEARRRGEHLPAAAWQFLLDALDEYDRLTGRTTTKPVDLVPAALAMAGA